MFFHKTRKGSVTSFSILFNFQGPVRLSLAADSLFSLPPLWLFVKLFFEVFRFFVRTWEADFRSASDWFLPVYFSRRSHSFPLRLALEYITILLPIWQALFALFSTLFSCLAV